jgi:hypothetical protein
MEILVALIGVGMVLAFPVLAIVALVKANSSSAEIRQLKQRIQRLQDQLDEFKNRFSSSQPPDQTEQKTANKPKVTQPKQAALVVPEPVTSAALQQEKQVTALPPPPPQPPPPPPALDQEQTIDPIPKPIRSYSKKTSPRREAHTRYDIRQNTGKMAEPEPVAATVQAESPMPAKIDAESIEMKLGTYWFVRIGVMLVLTSLGFLAYVTDGFGFIGLPPGAKASLFYFLSAALGGVGFWIQRTKEQLKNYGQVLLAGGFAGVYFTTYAAHVIPPVKIIDDATIALLLLFAWGGFMVWVADRLKSETIALFAIGASYYATYVPLIHSDGTGDVSGDGVILFSNLVLAVAAVVFMLRNRWLKMPVLSLSASYAGFLLWRLRVDEPLLTIAVSFAVSLWLVYTAAVFLSRSGAFSDRQRATFLTANNAAMFGLLMVDVLKDHKSEFWILPMVVGIALLGCALAATRFLEDQSLSRKSYLTQGLVLVTLGLMTMGMVDSLKGPILAAESVVLLFMAIRRKNFIIQIGSLIVAAIAAVYALLDTLLGREDFFLAGLFTGLIFLFNARLCHARIESAGESLLRPRVSYLTGLALVVGLFAYLSAPEVMPSGDWVPTILLATTVLFTGSVYRLKIREFLLLGQAPALLGLLLTLGLAVSASEFTWPLLCALALTLGQAHWWRWQRDQFSVYCPSWARSTHRSNVPLANRLTVIIEIIFSVGFVLQLLVWLSVVGVELDQKWLWLGSLLTVGMTLYSVLTRARFIGLFSQVYLLVSCWVIFKICIEGSDEYPTLTLIPIATMYLMNLGIPIAIARIGQVPEMIHAMVDWVQLAYRIIAAALGLLWIHSFVPDEWQVLVFILVGVAFFAVQCLRSGREWEWAALVYALVGYCTLIIEFTGKIASWESLLAIAVLFGVQKLARRRENVLATSYEVPDWAHKWLILVGGTLLFIWLSIKVSAMGGHGPDDPGLLTITWTILALGYFGLGLGLKERWYQLMGLGTLALGLFSVIIEFIGGKAYWESLLAIAVLFVGQQLARRRGNEVKVPDGVHKWLILVGGTLLFTWLSIKVSLGDPGLSTLTWTILALGYFGFGLGWQERWFRLMGLGTLAIALVSLVPIIWGMKTEMKIASFFVMGLVFIGLGFVYTRFKDQIKKLL